MNKQEQELWDSVYRSRLNSDSGIAVAMAGMIADRAVRERRERMKAHGGEYSEPATEKVYSLQSEIKSQRETIQQLEAGKAAEVRSREHWQEFARKTETFQGEKIAALELDLVAAREQIRQLTDLWHTWEKRAMEAGGRPKVIQSNVSEEEVRDVLEATFGRYETSTEPPKTKPVQSGAPKTTQIELDGRVWTSNHFIPAESMSSIHQQIRDEVLLRTSRKDAHPSSLFRLGTTIEVRCTCGLRIALTWTANAPKDKEPVQTGALRRFLVEVAPQKDETHPIYCRTYALKYVHDDPGELRISLDYTKAAMSVRELPEMPRLPQLHDIYERAVRIPAPKPEHFNWTGLRAVLRACGLEVKE